MRPEGAVHETGGRAQIRAHCFGYAKGVEDTSPARRRTKKSAGELLGARPAIGAPFGCSGKYAYSLCAGTSPNAPESVDFYWGMNVTRFAGNASAGELAARPADGEEMLAPHLMIRGRGVEWMGGAGK